MGDPSAPADGTILARHALRKPHRMKPASFAAATATGLMAPLDLFVRYIVLPLVMAVGLYGLVHYAVTAENGITDQLDPTRLGTTGVR